MNNQNLEIRHCNQNHAFGIWDLKANAWKIKPQYKDVYPSDDGDTYVVMNKDRYYGLICSKTGDELLPCNQICINQVGENSISLITQGQNKFSVYHIPTHKRTKFIFTDVSKFSEGYAFAKLDDAGKWGVINEQGSLCSEFVFDKPSKFENHFAIVSINGKTLNLERLTMRTYTDEEVSDMRAEVIDDNEF